MLLPSPDKKTNKYENPPRYTKNNLNRHIYITTQSMLCFRDLKDLTNDKKVTQKDLLEEKIKKELLVIVPFVQRLLRGV